MKKFLGEFKTFALKGNMIDLAVGMIIGSAFTGIVGRSSRLSTAHSNPCRYPEE